MTAQKTEAFQNIDYLRDHVSSWLGGDVERLAKSWQAQHSIARLWAADATLWTGSDEAQWLGWLQIVEEQFNHLADLESFAREVAQEGYRHMLLMGMGGSSLCPEVLSMTFNQRDRSPGFPDLHVLDSTDPAQIKAIESALDLKSTLFIVSSKSGTTLEPNIFMRYFYALAPKNFIAITDPGSKFEALARELKFRCIFHGVRSIGGRYSALSNFGMIPAAAMGINVRTFLQNAQQMVQACRVENPLENPGALLGLILGAAAKQGRDKLTLCTSPRLWDLGAWLEQLLAESTGKIGRGIIPVDSENLAAPEVYGQDRIFAYISLQGDDDPVQRQALLALEKAGHPVVRMELAQVYDLGREFFRWEMATAVAGSVIGINPFDQPDVEASKIVTRELTSDYEKNGRLPEEKPFFETEGIALFADAQNVRDLQKALEKSGARPSVHGYLQAHFSRLTVGDYFAALAYVPMNDDSRRELQGLRLAVRDQRKVATCLGFGPRFLHSTGQAYKGGPNSGVFLQITHDAPQIDLKVPGQKYSFGVVKAAQARGDFQVLNARRRRALRVHLTHGDIQGALANLRQVVQQALSS